MLVKVKSLTPGEKLRIMRRREGMTIEQAARRHDVGAKAYRDWEEGERNGVPEVRSLGSLDDHEQCVVTRRRTGYDALECAKEMGVSRSWFCRMEKGRAPVAPLIAYWKS